MWSRRISPRWRSVDGAAREAPATAREARAMVEVAFCGQAVIDFLFTVETIPTEPMKHRARDTAIVGGGCAATAAVAACRLGAGAHMIGRLGQDMTGDIIAADLVREGVDCTGLRRFAEARSSCSSVLVDAQGERLIVNFRDDAMPDGAAWIALGDVAAVMTDTRWSEGAIAVLDQARTRGIPGVLDAEAPIDADVAMAASHVAFSKQGLLDFTGMDDRDGALAVAAARLRGWVAVTDGALGTFIATARGIRHVPAPEVTVVDTLGAGDVWHGAFAVALAEGMDEVRAVAFANATAALKCTRPGGRDGAPLRSEVDEMMKGWEP